MSPKKKLIIVLSSALAIIIIAGVLLFIINKNKSTPSPIPEETEQEQSVAEERMNFSEKTDFKDAVTQLEDKINSGDNTYGNYLDLGVSYYNTQNLEGAEESYTRAIQKDPSVALTYNNLGNVLRDKEDYRGAEANYRKAIELDPNFINAYLNLAVMFSTYEKNPSSAIAVLEQGKASNPENTQIPLLLEEYRK